MVVLVSLPPGKVCHLNWWIMKFMVDNFNMFYMNVEIGNDEFTEIKSNLQD